MICFLITKNYSLLNATIAGNRDAFHAGRSPAIAADVIAMITSVVFNLILANMVISIILIILSQNRGFKQKVTLLPFHNLISVTVIYQNRYSDNQNTEILKYEANSRMAAKIGYLKFHMSKIYIITQRTFYCIDRI